MQSSDTQAATNGSADAAPAPLQRSYTVTSTVRNRVN
jgi:hypothetical protein